MTADSLDADDHSGRAIILAVDDVAENRAVLRALLTRPGVEVVAAATGNAALEALLEHDVAVALLDVRMPDMSGFELAALMRGAERTRRVPVVFLSASTRQELGDAAANMPGVEFLTKPLDPQALRAAVDAGIATWRQQRAAARAAVPTPADVRTAAAADAAPDVAAIRVVPNARDLASAIAAVAAGLRDGVLSAQAASQRLDEIVSAVTRAVSLV